MNNFDGNSDQIVNVVFLQSANNKLINKDLARLFFNDLLLNIFSINEFLVNFIFVDVLEISKMNKKYLHHIGPTDVITFDFSEDFKMFGGDIYICPEVIKENSKHFNTTIENETIRVMCHGVLHLMGFDDKNENDIKIMREKEEFCLSKYHHFVDSHKS